MNMFVFWLVQLYHSAVKEAFYLKDITAVTTPELLVINESYINYDNWIWKTGKQVAQQDRSVFKIFILFRMLQIYFIMYFLKIITFYVCTVSAYILG